MNYNELKEYLISKKIELKDLANELEMTPNGLRESIKNETIPLRKLKMLCDILKINPTLFFENSNYGLTITTGHVQAGNGNKIIIENKDREIEMLKQRIADKDEIIKLLRQANSNVHGYGNVAEGK